MLLCIFLFVHFAVFSLSMRPHSFSYNTSSPLTVTLSSIRPPPSSNSVSPLSPTTRTTSYPIIAIPLLPSRKVYQILPLLLSSASQSDIPPSGFLILVNLYTPTTNKKGLTVRIKASFEPSRLRPFRIMRIN